MGAALFLLAVMPQTHSAVFRDVRGESCSVGECSHACEAGEKALFNGLLDPLPPKSLGLQLHQVADRVCELGENATVAACQAGVSKEKLLS